MYKFLSIEYIKNMYIYSKKAVLDIVFRQMDNSSDVDEFNDELQFDSTISSGFGGPGQGDYRSTPITYGVCATPQPLPTKPEGQVKHRIP